MKFDWGNNGEDLENVKFKGVGRHQLRKVRLVEFIEFSKAGVGEIGMVHRVGMLGLEVLRMDVAGKSSHNR